MNDSYWTKTLRQQISRRRALLGGASLGLGGISFALLGCGGSDSSDGGGQAKDKSGLIYSPVPSTKKAKSGGVLKHYEVAETTSFDATGDSSAQAARLAAAPFYPRLLSKNFVPFPDDADGTSSGETAKEWEVSPDKLQITMKLRQGMIWDRRSPTSGRAIDSQDVLFAWNKFRTVNANAASLRYDPKDAAGGPIESMTAPDNGTIVIKLHQPYAEIIPLLSAFDLFYIMPRESEKGFDPKNTVRGHGMFQLESYVPGASYTWVKNPDFYVSGRPFFDKVELPIVTEYAAQLAQFKAGNIYTDVVTNAQQDVLRTKADHPETLLTQADIFPTSATNMIQFGWEDGTPWRDTRVRQAVSMMIDREAYIDVIDNREAFRKDGLELAVRMNSVVPAGWADYWLDPSNDKEFGPNAKYLKFNMPEAKKLLSAAGVKDGLEFEFAQGGFYGDAYTKLCAVYAGMLQEGGLKPQVKVVPTSGQWLPKYGQAYRISLGLYKPGDGFTGMAVVPDRNFVTSPVQLFNHWNIGGGSFRGAAPEGVSVTQGDPKLQDLTVKIIQEFDRQKQITLVHDLARYATEKSYYVPRPSSPKAFSLWWPVIGNLGAYRTAPNGNTWVDQRQNWWIDDTQKPLAKS